MGINPDKLVYVCCRPYEWIQDENGIYHASERKTTLRILLWMYKNPYKDGLGHYYGDFRKGLRNLWRLLSPFIFPFSYEDFDGFHNEKRLYFLIPFWKNGEYGVLHRLLI